MEISTLLRSTYNPKMIINNYEKLTVEERQAESKYVAELVSNNIQHQQLWTDVTPFEITLSTDSSFKPATAAAFAQPATPLISPRSLPETLNVPSTYKLTLLTAVPPKRLFVEDRVPADYQEEKDDKEGEVKAVRGHLYKEFILPCITEQEWSIREWVEVFQQLDKVWERSMGKDGDDEDWEKVGVVKSDTHAEFVPDYKPRRLIMACVTNDGTVVYYIINRDITPPRRN